MEWRSCSLTQDWSRQKVLRSSYPEHTRLKLMLLAFMRKVLYSSKRSQPGRLSYVCFLLKTQDVFASPEHPYTKQLLRELQILRTLPFLCSKFGLGRQ